MVGARTLAHGGAVVGVESHGKYLSDERIMELFPYVGSEKGKIMRNKMWGEMAAEVGKVVDCDKAVKGELGLSAVLLMERVVFGLDLPRRRLILQNLWIV